MTDSIFNSSNPQNAPAEVGALERLVGEGKKFADAEALAKGKEESDSFIKSMQQEMAELRQELKARLSLEELYAKTQQAQQVTNNPPISSGNPQGSVEQGQDNGKNAASPMTQAEVQKMVRDALAREQTQATRNANMLESREELKKLFGDDYGNHLMKRADELHLDKTLVDEIASRSPKALLAMIGEAPKTNDKYVAPPAGQRNTSQVAFTSNTGVRNEAFWSEMKRNNLKEYMKPENQIQRHKDAQALGEKYFS